VSCLIERQFRVHYHPARQSTPARLGLLTAATDQARLERDDERIRSWIEQDWPRVCGGHTPMSLIGKLTARVITATDTIAAAPATASQNSARPGFRRSYQIQKSPPSAAANVIGTTNGLNWTCWICRNIRKSEALGAGRAKLAAMRSPRMIPA
jgi:hypothetical protein